MASALNKKRQASAAVGDKYLSPPVLVNELQKIIKKYLREGDTLWDPAAHDGRLLKPFASSNNVKNSDTRPEEGVELINFLDEKVTRPPNVKKMMIVMNPPFKLVKPIVKNERIHGVIYFLNKASTILKEGEYVITVCPPTVSNYNQIQKVAEPLILKQEYNFSKAIPFFDFDKQKNTKIYTTFQVWQRGSDKTVSPTSKLKISLTKKEELNSDIIIKNYDSAAPKLDDPPICFLSRYHTGKDVGRVYTSKETYGKIRRQGFNVEYNEKKNDIKMTPFETKKGLSYNVKGASSLVGVYIRDRRKAAYAMAKLHYLHMAGYYARCLGYYLFEGIQTIPTTYIRYLMQNINVPTRESLGIETFTIGNSTDVDALKYKHKAIAKVDPEVLISIIMSELNNVIKVEIEIKKEEYWRSSKKVFPKLKF